MIKIKEAIVVEGQYDKIKLSALVDTLIITTDGFRIFKDQSLVSFIKDVSRKRGIIILTDSDRAGFLIRNFVKKIASNGVVKHAYIPDVYGKEKRKANPSKEGLLGVEGMKDDIILEALKNTSVTANDFNENKKTITKADLFKYGLSGRGDSYNLRKLFTKELNLPKRISSNMFLDILNSMYTYEEFTDMAKKILEDNTDDKCSI